MLVVAITSRALFDLDLSHEIYLNEGLEAYRDYQVNNENTPLDEGQAFNLVKKLLGINKKLNKKVVEVILLSRNTADIGLRIFNSIEYHSLDIKKAAFTGGNSPHAYAKSFGAHLFLSSEFSDCKSALKNSIAAARIIPGPRRKVETDVLKVAFDGDAVIFSDESQSIFDRKGLKAFEINEVSLAKESLHGGPFKEFLFQLHKLQNYFSIEECPIRIALMTARHAPSHERVIRTLRDWNIRIDECLFLGGQDKVNFLKDYQADIFFDDQKEICDLASRLIPTGQVIRLQS